MLDEGGFQPEEKVWKRVPERVKKDPELGRGKVSRATGLVPGGEHMFKQLMRLHREIRVCSWRSGRPRVCPLIIGTI